MSNLKKIRVQHVDRDAKGVEVKTDVDVITDADCITMDDGDLRSGVKKMIDDRIGEVIDGAPKELDTLKEIATELEKNQSGVSTIIKAMNSKLEAKDLKDYAKTTEVDDKLKSKVSVVNGKGLSTNDFTDEDKKYINHLDIKASDAIELAQEAMVGVNNNGSKIALLNGKINNFKRCIVLTQSEYDALSTTEKNRADTLYFFL